MKNTPEQASTGGDALPIAGLVIGCVLFGLGSLIIVFVPLGSFAMSFWRLLVGTAVFASLALWQRPAFPKGRRTWLFAALAGVFLNVDLALWHESIRAVGPGISTLLNSLQIFFLAAIGWFFFAERLNRWQNLSLLLAISGVALIGSPEFGHNHHALWGFASGIISGGMLAASMTSIRKTHEQEAISLIALMLILNGAGALSALPVALVAGETVWPRGLADVGLIMVYGLVMQCLAWSLIAFAIPRLSLALTGLILLTEPVAALLIDAFWLGKPITALQWSGALLTLFAIYLGSVKRRAT
ncbi:MAG: DMT family transporter [Cardiobacteriaceae bacterium]|nr:DMT family transporter [Cardiobacteriaceae bacterium]